MTYNEIFWLVGLILVGSVAIYVAFKMMKCRIYKRKFEHETELLRIRNRHEITMFDRKVKFEEGLLLKKTRHEITMFDRRSIDEKNKTDIKNQHEKDMKGATSANQTASTTTNAA